MSKDTSDSGQVPKPDTTLSSPLRDALNKFHRKSLKLDKQGEDPLLWPEPPKEIHSAVKEMTGNMAQEIIAWHSSVGEYKKSYYSREFLFLPPDAQKKFRNEYKKIHKEFFERKFQDHLSDWIKYNQQATNDPSKASEMLRVATNATKDLEATRQQLEELTDRIKQVVRKSVKEAPEATRKMPLGEFIARDAMKSLDRCTEVFEPLQGEPDDFLFLTLDQQKFFEDRLVHAKRYIEEYENKMHKTYIEWRKQNEGRNKQEWINISDKKMIKAILELNDASDNIENINIEPKKEKEKGKKALDNFDERFKIFQTSFTERLASAERQGRISSYSAEFLRWSYEIDCRDYESISQDSTNSDSDRKSRLVERLEWMEIVNLAQGHPANRVIEGMEKIFISSEYPHRDALEKRFKQLRIAAFRSTGKDNEPAMVEFKAIAEKKREIAQKYPDKRAYKYRVRRGLHGLEEERSPDEVKWIGEVEISPIIIKQLMNRMGHYKQSMDTMYSAKPVSLVKGWFAKVRIRVGFP